MQALASPIQTVAATLATAVVQYAARRGVAAALLADLVGLDVAALDDPFGRVPRPLFHRLLDVAADRARDPDLGLHVGATLPVDALHLVGPLVLGSEVRDALRAVARLAPLLDDASALQLESDGRQLTIAEAGPFSMRRPRHHAELAAATIVSFVRRHGDPQFVPDAVAFTHTRPESIANHVRVLGIVPTFGAPRTQVTIAGRAGSLRLATAAPGARYLARLADSLLAEPVGDIVTRVRTAIDAELHSGASLQAISRQLGLSARTLQRRLTDAGTSYAELVDGARRERIDATLAAHPGDLAAVARALGFESVSSLQRATHRWFGTSARARALTTGSHARVRPARTLLDSVGPTRLPSN